MYLSEFSYTQAESETKLPAFCDADYFLRLKLMEAIFNV